MLVDCLTKAIAPGDFRRALQSVCFDTAPAPISVSRNIHKSSARKQNQVVEAS